jgi:hypothetical protein
MTSEAIEGVARAAVRARSPEPASGSNPTAFEKSARRKTKKSIEKKR